MKALTAHVKKHNLPTLKSTTSAIKSHGPTEKEWKISVSESQRIVALAKERKYPLENLFKYELTYRSLLFEHGGLFKSEDSKSSLITELEKNKNYNSQEEMNKDVETCLVIDVMLVIRKMWRGSVKFKDLADKFCLYLINKANVQNTTAIVLVFDSYFEKSLKSSEHQRR